MILLFILLVLLALAWGLADHQLSRPIVPPPPVKQVAPARTAPPPAPTVIQQEERSGDEPTPSAPAGNTTGEEVSRN